MILSLLLATLAQAVPATPPAPPPPFRGMGLRGADADGDGVVTRQEAMAQAAAMFDRVDTDHDGKLDAAELAAARPGRGPGRRGGGGDMPPPPPAR